MRSDHFRVGVLIATAVLLTACGTTEQAGVAMSSSWVGRSADDFFAQHGAAETEQTLTDGRRVFIWKAQARASFGGPQVSCSADIVASRNGTVVSIRPREDSLGLWNLSRCAEIFG